MCEENWFLCYDDFRKTHGLFFLWLLITKVFPDQLSLKCGQDINIYNIGYEYCNYSGE